MANRTEVHGLRDTVALAVDVGAGRFVDASGRLPQAGGHAHGVVRSAGRRGDPATVDVIGIVPVVLASAVAEGDDLQAAADGRAEPAATGRTVAKALDAGAAGGTVHALVFPAGAAPAAAPGGGAPAILVASGEDTMQGADATLDLPDPPEGEVWKHLEFRAWSWFGGKKAQTKNWEGFLRGLYHRDGETQASWYHGEDGSGRWLSGGNKDSETTYAVGIVRRDGSRGYTLEYDPDANRLSYAPFSGGGGGQPPNLGDLLVTGYSGPT